MNLFFHSIVILGFVAMVNTKYLHMKETYTEKNEDVQFQDFFNYDDNVYTVKDRFVRHVELVTESVLDHLLKEIHNKYPQSKNDSINTIPKMMKRLKMKLKRHLNKKKNRKLKRKHSKLNSTSHQDVMATTST